MHGRFHFRRAYPVRVAAVAVAVALALLLARSPVLHASDGIPSQLTAGPTPTRAPTSAPGETATASDTPSRPPRSTPAPYFIAAPSLAGKVLHWTQILYSYNPDTADPSNGQSIQADVWLALGADSRSQKLHAINTYLDGTFHQELVENGGQELVVLGKVYPSSPMGCAIRGAPPGPGFPPPPFVDKALLAQSGFALVGGLTQKLPSSPHLMGIDTLRTYLAGSDVRIWEKREKDANDTTRLTRFEVGADGRVVLSQVRLTDRDGVVQSEGWRAYGPLDVYDPSTIPDHVFALSQAALNVCPGAAETLSPGMGKERSPE